MFVRATPRATSFFGGSSSRISEEQIMRLRGQKTRPVTQQQRTYLQRRAFAEALEERAMLAGVTLITHGFELFPGYPDWMDQMAIAVAKRAGTLGPSGNVAWYTAS